MTEATGRMSPWPLIYLASGSARRRAILEELGIPHRPLAVEVDEIVAATPRQTVEENARRKLWAGLRSADPGAIVLAADTVLEAQGQLLGKAADETTATQYLQILSGAAATAYSAVALARAGAAEGCLATETAAIHFKLLPPEVIQWYVSTGEPMGRAGAFGIGRLGEVLTESVEGGYSCVSGLPKTALLLALGQVAGEQMPELLRHVPLTLMGPRVQSRPLPARDP
ncbi:MAG: Maf family protein [Planctomycetes bacterium]|nr:Maf family protein [Planctomycetota bacterium]